MRLPYQSWGEYKYLYLITCTRVVTEINGHRDKQSSEIVTQKWLKGFNNNVTQTKCYGKHRLGICYYLSCEILLLTLLKFESFEDRLSL